ncbi:MAG: M20/M25/M40 family metallo-hydrolase, partial [Actinobacteria bacterium]|nr:M20/M25/M40 family metallo-hydrolase [Actinomycetota bacterium]
VASILECLKIITERNIPVRETCVILTISEESGLLGAKNLDISKVKPEVGFVFDGGGRIGTIITKAPYQNSIYANFQGKAAHAGVCPEKGINSIYAASSGISDIKWGRIDEETTCNVGIIKGGVARNIVPEKTEVHAETRSMKLSRLEEVTHEILSHFERAALKTGAKLKYSVVREYDGFEIPEDAKCVEIAKQAIKRLGIKPKFASSGGGSDINIFNARGKRAVNLSSGMENVHSNREYVRIEELVKLPALMLGIIGG